MRYHVAWKPAAQKELARIWTSATDRQAVADASDAIDRRLRISPETAGWPYGADRLLVQEPLAVVFSIIPDDRRVDVLRVWRW